MKLVKYRVTNFRSVSDSGWIEVSEVTALIGANESGKTNLLLPLWRLNPATGDGAINPTSDHPRRLHTEFRAAKPSPVFVEAVFALDKPTSAQLAKLTGVSAEKLNLASVSRRYDGSYVVDFPGVESSFTAAAVDIRSQLSAALAEINDLPATEPEQDLRVSVANALGAATEALTTTGMVSSTEMDGILAPLKDLQLPDGIDTSMVAARFRRTRKDLESVRAQLARSHPRESAPARKLVQDQLPKFVYYANYGNLDSEIYLPTVIANLKRTDMGQREAAKARTLKVLFEFVKLSPQEILDLGHETGGRLDDNQAKVTGEHKRERSILLQSASALLTQSFRDWWKQGTYRFRFEADGDFFRLWVSDDKRPEEVEFEGRSSGLQWFLSFYLVFLVESGDRHSNSILLLDEPGVTLHPLSQRDLSVFFDGLAEHNQLLYTTHSPFLVDADRLDRARKVYVAIDGTTEATANLSAQDGDISKRGAGYAVHAAIGLTVAESLLLGCRIVVVEGQADQHYLTAMKTILIAAGRLTPGRELVFPPAGGAKGVRAVASVLSGRDDDLPVALLDSDEAGKRFAKALKDDLYVGSESLVLEVGTFAAVSDAEVEDLMPPDIVYYAVDRWQRGPEKPFADVYQSGKPVVPQIEAWAAHNGVKLEKGWKPELAKRVKSGILELGASGIPTDTLDAWGRLFTAFQPEHAPAEQPVENSAGAGASFQYRESEGSSPAGPFRLPVRTTARPAQRPARAALTLRVPRAGPLQ